MRIGIIGGGVYGSAMAYFLKRFGADDIVLFEKGALGSESTGYSAGIVRHHYSNDIQIRMAKRGREILENLSYYVNNDGGFHQNGYLILANTETERKFRKTIRRQQALGIDVELVDPGELDGYLPGIDPQNVTIGAFEREAGFADPYLVTVGFAKKAQELGATIHTNTRVTDIRRNSDTVTHVITPDQTYSVDYLVNAAGPWGREIGDMVGIDLPLEHYESKIAVLQASQAYEANFPTLSDHSLKPDMYTKPEPGGEFLVGGIDRPQLDSKESLEGVNNEFLRLMSKRIEERLPGYADAKVVDTWSGVITVTPDAIQILGVPEGIDNFFNIVGGSGHGFKEAPAIAEAVAKTILGEDPGVDLTPYRLERFERGNGFTGISTETYTDS